MQLELILRAALPAPLYQQLFATELGARLSRGFSWGALGSIASRLTTLVAMIFVARILGPEPFGALGLIQSTLGVAGMVAGVGLGAAVTRFVAHHSRTDPARAGRMIGLVTVVSTATVLMTAGGLIALSGTISSVVFSEPDLRDGLILGALLMATQAFRGIQEGVFVALEQFRVLAALNILEGCIALLGMVWLASVYGLVGALLGLTVSSLIVLLLGRILLFRKLKTRGIQVRYVLNRDDLSAVFNFSVPMFLANTLATPILWVAITYLARSENGLFDLGIYQAAYQWHGPLIFLPMILMTVSIPILVQVWESGARERFRKLVFSIFGVMLAISVPPAVIGALFSSWLMGLYGGDFDHGWLTLVLLLVAAPLHGISKVAFGVLSAMNRPWWVLGANALWGLVMLVLAIPLINKFGGLGLAVAFLLAHAALCLASVVSVLAGSRR